MILIPDSIRTTGMPDGEYLVAGLPVTVRKDRALLTDGSLAGSLITLYDAVRNAITYGVPEEEAILSATYRPAKAIHMEDKIGSIEMNKRADVLIVDQDLRLIDIILRGKRITYS